ncbi:hypothetical protein MPSEU_000084800 [Mayamaea pseudoterrestris]|nr:hypothetical protein MPSEU_000084800 [Mayamaea pseudoterrestris]
MATNKSNAVIKGMLVCHDRRSQHPHPTATHNQDRIDDDRKQTSNDQKEASNLLRQAPQLLKQVEDSFLVKHHRRSYPTFRASEVTVGPLLGVGGFGVVFEVENLTLRLLVDTDDDKGSKAIKRNEKLQEQPTELPNSFSESLARIVTDTDKSAHQNKTSDVSFLTPIEQLNDFHDDKASVDKDDSHYEVHSARRHMVQFVRRNGEARYAIKRLHKDLPELARVRGMIDLAMEATFLSGLWHPNIIKMRAVAEGDLLQRHFFLIMDRLYDTLDVRIKQWKVRYSRNKGNLFGFGANKEQLYQLTVERLTVAYDLAAALTYMHANQLVYRDLKQQNIGFDIRGDVKIFDFGLSKSISDDLKAKDKAGNPNYGYNLTPRTGSIPYMSPEIVERKPYDEKCDVFSFAILFWEMLALRHAFRGYTRGDFLTQVVRQHERPRIGRHWPICAPIVLSEAWHNDPRKRPPMKRVATLIRGDLNELSHDNSVTDRSVHMRNRSAHSAHLRLLLDQDSLDENDDTVVGTIGKA